MSTPRYKPRTPQRSLLDSIRRTIEERNLLTARSRIKYVSAMNNAYRGKGVATITVEARVQKLKGKVVEELISSEKNYIKQLTIIVETFKHGLLGVLEKKEMDALFSNVELIKSVNEEFCKELTKETSIAQAFQKYAPMLKIYSSYARNYLQATEMLQSLISTNHQGAAIIKEKEERFEIQLAGLLITPIQRIPRYKLLLEQILSLTKGEERTEIQASLETINSVAEHMNEMVRGYENTRKILEIKSYFHKDVPVELIEPGKWLIKHGIVNKIPRSHKRYIILLSDQLYFCKIKPGNKLKLFSPIVVPLRKSIVNLVGNTIMIHCTGETPVKFTVRDEDDLVEWHRTIEETIKNLRRRVATLRKDSSRGGARRLVSGRENRTSVTPGKLKRCLNISARLDEIVDFLSPKRRKRETPKTMRSIQGT